MRNVGKEAEASYYSHSAYIVCIVTLMSTSRTLLGLLEAEPAHGYTLKHRYDEHFAGVRPLAFGQVYATLARFERDGLAHVTGTEPGEGPERRLYAITADGVSTLEYWLSTPEPPTSYAGSALFAKTTLALLSGRDPGDVLDAQRVAHLGRMRELTAARASADEVELLALTYELNHLDADLRWIQEAGRRLIRSDATTDHSEGER